MIDTRRFNRILEDGSVCNKHFALFLCVSSLDVTTEFHEMVGR